jgi:RNA polymerase sigma factor (sigma-70 family)
MSASQVDLFLRHMRVSIQAAEWVGRSDADLLAAYSDRREPAAFTELVRRYGPLVLQTCRRVLGPSPDAEDAFQATFTVLANRASRLRREPVGGWLHRVAFRAAGRIRVSASRRHKYEQRKRASTPPPVETGPDLTWEELKPVLDEELDRLPEASRRLLVGCYLLEKTHSQLADDTGIPLGSLARHLDKARGQLRTRLLARGITLSAVALAAALPELGRAAPLKALLLAQTVAALTSLSETTGLTMTPAAAQLAKSIGAELAPRSFRWVIGALVLLTVGSGISWYALKGESDPSAKDATDLPSSAASDTPKSPVDLQGDALPEGAVARLGTHRFRSVQVPSTIDFLPDGKTLVTGGEGKATVWDLETGKEVRRFAGGGYDRRAYAYPYWAHITAKDEKGEQTSAVQVVNVEDGKQLPVSGDMGRGASLSVLAGKPVVLRSGAEEKSVLITDAVSGKELGSWQSFGPPPPLTAFSPDGKVVVVGWPKRFLCLCDAQTGRPIARLNAAFTGMERVAFTADSQTIVVATGGVIEIYEGESGKARHTLRPAKPVFALAVAPDGHTLASASPFVSRVQIWDLESGKEKVSLQGAYPWANALAFTPDGKGLLAACLNRSLIHWDLATGQQISKGAGHLGIVRSLAVSPDGQHIATAGGDHTVRVWDASTGRQLQAFEAGWRSRSNDDEPGPMPIAFSRDGRSVVALDWDRTGIVWDVKSGEIVRRFGTTKGEILTVGLSADARFAVAAVAGVVEVADVATGKPYRSWSDPDMKFATLPTLSSDGTRALWVIRAPNASAQLTVKLDDVVEGRPLCRFGVSPDYRSFVLSPDGRLVAAWRPGGPGVWEVATGRLLWEKPLIKPSKSVSWNATLCFSPDGATLAVAENDSIRLWDLRTGQELAGKKTDGGEAVTALAFLASDRLISTSEDSTALIWDIGGQIKKARPALKPNQMKDLWEDLAGDPLQAYRAADQLSTDGLLTLPFLREQLRPVPLPDRPQIERLADRLEANSFEEREAAARQLRELGEPAVPELARLAQDEKRQLEARNRLEQLVEAGRAQRSTPGETRELRSLAILERLGAPEARALLEALARGAPGARLTREAAAALGRLPPPPP